MKLANQAEAEWCLTFISRLCLKPPPFSFYCTPLLSQCLNLQLECRCQTLSDLLSGDKDKPKGSTADTPKTVFLSKCMNTSLNHFKQTLWGENYMC